MKKTNELLTINEVADYMGIHKITLYRLIKSNKIPAFKIGRQWRFKKELLDHWILGNTSKKEDVLGSATSAGNGSSHT